MQYHLLFYLREGLFSLSLNLTTVWVRKCQQEYVIVFLQDCEKYESDSHINITDVADTNNDDKSDNSDNHIIKTFHCLVYSTSYIYIFFICLLGCNPFHLYDTPLAHYKTIHNEKISDRANIFRYFHSLRPPESWL